MYFIKYCIIFSVIVIPFFTTQAIGRNDQAIKKFETAINACERGLQMNMPKSRSSLVILQNLFKKYQRHRDAALALEGSLKNSEEERYTGSFFSRKSFLEVYQICERDLAQKITQAETEVANKVKNIESRQPVEGTETNPTPPPSPVAEQPVTTAPAASSNEEEGPAPPGQEEEATVTPPTEPATSSATKEAEVNTASTVAPETVAKETEATPAPAQQVATPAVKTAAPVLPSEATATSSTEQELATLPKQPVTLPSEKTETVATAQPPQPAKDSGTTPSSKTAEATSSVDANKDTTEDKTTVAAIGDRAPPASAAPPEASADNGEEAGSEETVDDEEAEYKGVLAKAQGDRLKVLKDEKRLPEFVDDEDFNYLKAKVWQYERATGDKCNIYNFKGNQLVKTVKNFAGACPPLEGRD